MNRQIQFSCTMMVPNTPGTFPIVNRQHQLSCDMVNMQPAAQANFLKDNADNVWFVLGAYFFAFFPWAMLNNIDFISEKWRTCRRTRTLAHIHLAGSIFPIIYVALYAEAQRRAGENTEFGAALAALMFNVFQLLRTIMGIVQLNAFVAWCKDAMECVRALSRKDEGDAGSDRASRPEISEQDVSGCIQETRNVCGLFELEVVGTWVKRRMGHIRGCMCRTRENSEHETTADEEDVESAIDTYLTDVYHDQSEDIEEKIKVNNAVVDNELGGREVTVLPSWKKMMDGMKKGRFEPSRWLRTDRVMLNTVRWCGAFLCGMGEHWSVNKHASAEDGEILQMFFCSDMAGTRYILQSVEWNVDMGNDGPELMNIGRYGAVGPTELAGEMSTAYGTGFRFYDVRHVWNVKLYSFEFNSLVSSYPANESEFRSGNRESVKVGLAHSVLLAKHFGVEKLKAIRQCYERYGLPLGRIRESAFRLLHKQASGRIPDDSDMWGMFGGKYLRIPLFPYRMQAVALWDEATNWRVLQASAHQDIQNSLRCSVLAQIDEGEPFHSAPSEVNFFDYCADWSRYHVSGKGSLGVVIETVRAFLAEWISGSEGEPNWEPEVPKNSFEFDRIGTIPDESFDIERIDIKQNVIWVCQRELQRKLAKMENKGENFSGNAALIMLFLLGFPLLRMEEAQDSEFGSNENQGLPETSTVPSSNRRNIVDVFVQLWHTRTVLAPQNISLMIRVDLANRRVSLKLRNDGGDARFIWQDWVDAAMGCLKGIEETGDDDLGYGRTILKANLCEPMVELCPLRVNEDGIEPEVEKTSTVKIWMGWLPFDVRICKFELEQWFAACNANLNGAQKRSERWTAEQEVSRFEEVIEGVVAEEYAEVESSIDGADD